MIGCKKELNERICILAKLRVCVGESGSNGSNGLL